MDPLIFSLPGSEDSAKSFARAMGAGIGNWSHRRFPDTEFYLRVGSEVQGATTILFGSLDRPDPKTLPLLFLAKALKDLGAKRVLLVAPYLAYLRQDTRFQAGEGLTSRYFAQILSLSIDGLVTVDPHLHRYASLREIYQIPTQVVQAAGPISEWIRAQVRRPLIVGPDRESEQWASEIARAVDAPCLILEKTRKGDREVEMSSPPMKSFGDRRPVIVDDIISSGETLAAAARKLTEAGFMPPAAVGIHAIFSGNASKAVRSAGVSELVTCNTIPHPTNQIDLTPWIADAVKKMV